LRGEHAAGSTREAQFIGDSEEVLELANIHTAIVIIDHAYRFNSLDTIASQAHSVYMTTTTIRTSGDAHPARVRWQLRHAHGFWVIAAALLSVLAFSTLPTPLYALYQQRQGFATWLITVIFAAYAVGVIASLFFVGHISDWAGRRRMVLVAIAIEILAAVIFIFWNDVSGLLVARFISGVGVGALTATATAHLSELRSVARPDESAGHANTVATVVNTGGLALGPLIAGVLAQFVPMPLLVPFVVFLVVLALAAVAVALVPETVVRPNVRQPYRPQRMSLPAGARSTFAGAAIAAFAGFAVFGLFTSLAPSVLAGTLHETSRLIAGLVPFSVFAASALSQIALTKLSRRVQLSWSLVLAVLGLAALAGGVVLANLPLFIASGVLSGAGVGVLFRTAIATAASLAELGRKGEVLAAIFLAAYIGLALPVLIVGAALIALPLVPVLVTFAAIVAALTVWAVVALLRASARPA
jgi:Major Facilitator Superfamily